MSSRYMTASIYPVLENALPRVYDALASEVPDRALFRSLERSDVLELQAFDNFHQIADLEAQWDQQWAKTQPFLAGDVRRQVLRFVEAPKDCATPLPQTAHIQLRYVEVKPPRYGDYRKWREETIFSVVRSASVVDVFLAYHTLISTKPGVMFISGFDADVARYNGVFQSDKYREIVRQAGDSYITGGQARLWTQIFQAIGEDTEVAA